MGLKVETGNLKLEIGAGKLGEETCKPLPQNTVAIISERHSRMLLAGIQKKTWMPAPHAKPAGTSFAGMRGGYRTHPSM
jgi:hypothetical protein